MIHSASGLSGALARLAFAFLAPLLASCGGGVTAPPEPTTPTALSITPATATLYSDLPTSFIVTGGNGNYIVTSSNQAIVPVVGTFTGNMLTVTPNPVAADTPVTLTIRDTGTTTPVSATLTVRPRTVTNTISVTPSATQPTECGTAVCSGSDAEVKTTLMQNGVPLVGRQVRFDVVSGDFRIITSAAGQPETLGLTGTALTDSSGTARIRVRANVDAPSQTVLLQITDVNSGAFQRASFMIAQATGGTAGFFVTPSSVTFRGSRIGECGNGIRADFYIFGGTPPYTVNNTNPAISVSPTVVTAPGRSFRVEVFGQCVDAPGLPIVVRDSQGRTTTVTVANLEGTTAAPTLSVAPSTVTLSDCASSANVTVVGGQGPGSYAVTSGSGSVRASLTGSTVTIQRVQGTPATTGPVTVGISDGRSTATVTVELQGAGADACPP